MRRFTEFLMLCAGMAAFQLVILPPMADAVHNSFATGYLGEALYQIGAVPREAPPR